MGQPGFDPWVGKIPWRRERLPAPVFWPGEFRGLYSPWGHKEMDMTEQLSVWNCLSESHLLPRKHYIDLVFTSVKTLLWCSYRLFGWTGITHVLLIICLSCAFSRIPGNLEEHKQFKLRSLNWEVQWYMAGAALPHCYEFYYLHTSLIPLYCDLAVRYALEQTRSDGALKIFFKSCNP